MNQKGLTYLLTLVLVVFTGTAISNSAADFGSLSKAGSLLQLAAGEILLDFSICEEPYSQNFEKTNNAFPVTSIETVSDNIPQNYFLTIVYNSEKEEIRRTNYWFTSQLRT